LPGSLTDHQREPIHERFPWLGRPVSLMPIMMAGKARLFLRWYVTRESGFGDGVTPDRCYGTTG
jgi:hypothetical protein